MGTTPQNKDGGVGEDTSARFDSVPFDDLDNSDGLPSEAIGKTMEEIFKTCAGGMSLYGENEKLYQNAGQVPPAAPRVQELVHATTKAARPITLTRRRCCVNRSCRPSKTPRTGARLIKSTQRPSTTCARRSWRPMTATSLPLLLTAPRRATSSPVRNEGWWLAFRQVFKDDHGDRL